MNHFRIAVIPGDGVGQEVTPEGVKALRAVAEVDRVVRLRVRRVPMGQRLP